MLTLPLVAEMSIVHGVGKLGVLGAGQMGMLTTVFYGFAREITKLKYPIGLGIAYVAALRAKVDVLLYDKSSTQLDRGLRLVDKLLAKDVAKGKIVEMEAQAARSRITVVPQDKGIPGLRDVDMVVEVCQTRILYLIKTV